MEEKEQSVMVALLPVSGTLNEVEFPHLTLVYCGETPMLQEEVKNDLLKHSSAVATLLKSITIKAGGIEVFGNEEKVDVLRLDPSPKLLALRSFFDNWDNGEFPVYKPHITLSKAGQSHPRFRSPMILEFDAIAVTWGDDRFIFRFNS